MLLFNRKKSRVQTEKLDDKLSVDVENVKRETHQTIHSADLATKRLNRLLKANGITLKIHIAAGGNHGG